MRDVHHDTAMSSLQQAGEGARFGFSDKGVENPCIGVQGFGSHSSTFSEIRLHSVGASQHDSRFE